jgi:GT2 family glycosyltransferase
VKRARHATKQDGKDGGICSAFAWTGDRVLSGFVYDPASLFRKFVVELLIDGIAIKTVRAEQFHDQLARDDVGDGFYGFSFSLREELLNSSGIAEARIANVGTLVGSPIIFGQNPPRRAAACGTGSVQWLGGLRFAGWLGEGEADENFFDVMVDGELVTRVSASGWRHVGADPETACAAKAFDFHLPQKFADSRMHRLAVTMPNGDPLPGSPVVFVSFPDGLTGALAKLGGADSERLRAEQFDCLVPASLPFSQFPAWNDRFATPDPGAPALTTAVVLLDGGAGDLDATLASLDGQTQGRWLAGALPACEPGVFDAGELRTFLAGDAADAQIVLFALSGTVLSKHALARMGAAFLEFEQAVVVYGDVEVTGPGQLKWPVLFSAFDYERFLEQGYCAHFFAMRRSGLDQALAAGVSNIYRIFNSLFDGGTPGLSNVVHIPEVLATLPPFDPAAMSSPLAAATHEHLQERGIKSRVDQARCAIMPAVRVSRAGSDEVTTIIIPTRNRMRLLQQCLASLQPAVSRRAVEILVIDNDSTDPDTLDYLSAIDGKQTRVIQVSGHFNFARLNNVAAQAATGANLCLLNNDVQALDDEWLEEMLGRLVESDVGAVGAMLLWPSGVIQHGGVVLGPSFAATHAFNDRMEGDPGYGDLLCVAHECSAVTAACLLTRRQDYLAVGGMDELRFPVNFNDVDYCLKLRAAGKRVVMTPHARLLHLESASRGSDQAADRKARFERELRNLRGRWGAELMSESYYSPALSLDPVPFSALAWPPRSRSPRAATRPVPVIAPPGL